jgi:flagellar FliL protein
MATAAKPGATTKLGEKPEESAEASAPKPKKSKKLLLIIIVLLLMIGTGAATYFLVKPAAVPPKAATGDTDATSDTAQEASRDDSADEKKSPPKYISLGTFTANLIHEEGDRYLQVAISVKVSKPDLEDRFKESNPEILHHVNMLLQSKRPSELATLEGKEKLANDLKAQIERVLGLTKTINSGPQSVSAPVATQPPQPKSGIEEVLFTSFIIQ